MVFTSVHILCACTFLQSLSRLIVLTHTYTHSHSLSLYTYVAAFVRNNSKIMKCCTVSYALKRITKEKGKQGSKSECESGSGGLRSVTVESMGMGIDGDSAK